MGLTYLSGPKWAELGQGPIGCLGLEKITLNGPGPDTVPIVHKLDLAFVEPDLPVFPLFRFLRSRWMYQCVDPKVDHWGNYVMC